MSRPILLLDVDGVLADFVGPTLDYVNTAWGYRAQRDDVKCWDIGHALDLAIERRVALRRFWTRPGFCRHLPVLPGALEAVDTLKQYAEIHLVTTPLANCPTWQHEREIWIERYFGISADYVHHCYHKRIVDGDVLVDDGVHNIQAWSSWRGRAPWARALLWTASHNTTSNDGIRVHGWDQVIANVRAVADELSSVAGVAA
jgi:5'-nucleotidase